MNKYMVAETERQAKASGLSERDAVLVSMKRDKKDKKDKKKDTSEACCSVSGNGPDFPWGLSVNLENESLDKLKIDSLPEVGSTVRIVAEARVESVSSRSDRESNGKKNRSVSLQITKMALSDAEEDADEDDTEEADEE